MNFLVLQHVDCEDMGLWEDCCREAGIGLEMVALHREAPIPPPHRFQAVISLGGPMNVYEPDRLPVFQWHGDTFSLPGGAVRLARSDACQNQAFRFGFGGIAYALQFHLEVSPTMIDQWVRQYGADLDGTADPAQMREQAPARCAALLPVARRVFKNFTRLVQLRCPGVGAEPADRPPQPARRRSARDLTVEQAWQRYRELMARGKLRCGVTCPLDRIGRCTGGCW
ncbi:MAG: hypothetical protein HY766_13830 [candidate division NC10 bacterium]|nr:hypothetical protein [candidate division NC10 bacterium]